MACSPECDRTDVGRSTAPYKNAFCTTGIKFPLDKAAEAVRKAMDGVGGQGKVMLEDKFSASEE